MNLTGEIRMVEGKVSVIFWRITQGQFRSKKEVVCSEILVRYLRLQTWRRPTLDDIVGNFVQVNGAIIWLARLVFLKYAFSFQRLRSISRVMLRPHRRYIMDTRVKMDKLLGNLLRRENGTGRLHCSGRQWPH